MMLKSWQKIFLVLDDFHKKTIYGWKNFFKNMELSPVSVDILSLLFAYVPCMCQISLNTNIYIVYAI